MNGAGATFTNYVTPSFNATTGAINAIGGGNTAIYTWTAKAN